MKYQSARRKLAVILTVAFMLGFAPFAPQTAYAAMPTSAVGSVWDGVDFAALTASGSGIYYGTYKHATGLDSSGGTHGAVTGRESTATPVLWRVMGEEANDNAITLMSEYVLDSKPFDGSSNVYVDSEIHSFLNKTSGGFPDNFTASELGSAEHTTVTTSTYVYNTTIYSSTDSGVSAVFYLPWGTYYDGTDTNRNKVWWSADDGSGTIPATYDLQNKVASLKNSSNVDWWLRSPYSHSSEHAFTVDTFGDILGGLVNKARGVRPAFKLNPQSVIFTSEIVSSGGDGMGTVNEGTLGYEDAAEGGVTRKFKLTVVGGNSSANVGTLSGVPTATQYVPVPSSNLNLSGLTANPAGTGDYTINYKIVAAGMPRTIVRYGFIPANSTSLTIDTSALTQNESYDVYVWLQKNNDINSNEGTMPTHFTLTMSAAPLSGDSYSPTFTRRTLTDTPTGVQVTAGMDMGTRLHVTANTLHPAGCKACDEIRARQAAGDVLALYDISLTGYHTGAYDVFIPFSGSGGTYTVLHCNKGVLEKQSGLYTNGGITTTWARLSPFAVVRGADITVPENVVVDPPKTGDAGGIGGVVMVLIGLCGLAVLRVARRKKIAE